jgi:hypothetical protein
VAKWSKTEIEAWLTPETRIVDVGGGALRPITLSVLTWLHYDTLLDAGYSHDDILACASLDGWKPEPAPFDMRFHSSIALYWQTHEKQRGPLTILL